MNKIIKDPKGGFLLTNGEIENKIHVIHCSETIEEIMEDLYAPYIVYEQVTNFPRLHLVTAWSKDNALQEVYEYLLEKEDDNNPQLISVEEVKV